MQTDDERRNRWAAAGMCHTPGYPAPSAPKYGDLRRGGRIDGPTGEQVVQFAESTGCVLSPWQRQVLTDPFGPEWTPEERNERHARRMAALREQDEAWRRIDAERDGTPDLAVSLLTSVPVDQLDEYGDRRADAHAEIERRVAPEVADHAKAAYDRLVLGIQPRPVPTYADRIADAKTARRWWRRLTERLLTAYTALIKRIHP